MVVIQSTPQSQDAGGIVQPRKILMQLDIQGNMKIADFGCGHGYFALPLAELVTYGTVYALDVVEDALSMVKSKAQTKGIANIQTIRGNLEVIGGSKLQAGSIDLVILANILFQSQKKEAILQEAGRVLKNGGELVLIEWVFGSQFAPKGGWMLSQDEALELVKTEGFTFAKDLRMDDSHYGLVFKK